MPLREFYCSPCCHRFERIVSSSADLEKDGDVRRCPKCDSDQGTRVLISRFAVGGRGDLRESTMHGCHDCFTGLPGDGEAPACHEASASPHDGHDH